MTGTASRIEVVRVADEHFGALADFYRHVWDPKATPDGVAASRAEAARRNPVTPGEAPPTWLVLQNGQAIAHLTTIPLKLWFGGSERSAYWMKGLWVLPDFQRSSAGFLVLRATAGLREASLALVHEPAAIRLFQAVGFADLGALPNRLRILRARSLLAQFDLDALGIQGIPRWVRSAAKLIKPGAPVLAPFFDAAAWLWSTVGTGPLPGLTTEISRDCAHDEIEGLWRVARQEIAAGPARGGGPITERYLNGEYVFVKVRSRGRLVGLGVVKRPRESGDPRLRGVRIASLSDLLYQPRQRRAGLALLRGAERAARELGADALLSSATAGTILPLLRRRAYLRLPVNLHVLARVPKDEATVPSAIADWWVTRGDSGGDESF